jgi:TonB dependent receptor/TonB-dependent Receptor Plug Domain
MRAPLHSLICAALAILCLSASTLHAQRVRGEVRIEVHDSAGATIAADAELLSETNQLHRTFKIAQDGRYTAQDLPFGLYRLNINAEGFAPWTKLVDVRSEVPLRIPVTLGVAPVATQVQVTDSATLVDPSRTGTIYSVGRQTIDQQMAAQPGRNLSDLVNQQPGWLYEANGVLHPRGSEYDVQYVFDGLPLTQNRSPAFAPEFDADDVESMRVLTATFPAEYGRKLGGVVEVTTVKDVPDGLHGQLDINGGSFSSISSSAALSYAFGQNRFSLSGNGFHTGRYLDPPVLENFTNRGNAGGFSTSYERDFSGSDRLRFTIIHNDVRFQVPNELVQQQAGQRQDITDQETSGQVFFQHTISPNLFLSLSGSVRDASAELTSNLLSTPVIISQSRGYREGYARADLSGYKVHHNWKTGVDSFFTPVHEALAYTITDPSQFDPGTQQQFQFADHQWDIEPSAYVQDEMHFGNWNISAGLRFDHYAFVVHESAWSPRVGVSRYVPSLILLLHASYDRVFQTPAMENLLLASSAQLNSVDPVVLRLPIRPARANYYEVGATKSVSGKLRIEANIFRRDFSNYADDDTLLDTGVSFPIAFSHARIFGEELRLEVPEWWRFSGYLSYSNQSGIGNGPITGGLFLGSDAAGVLTNTSPFAVSQDQRNTARARIRFQADKRVWVAASAQYGSGLPANLSSTETQSFLLAQYGSSILDRVNFDLERTRPTFSLDIAAGAQLYRKELRSVTLQIQLSNVTDRVNVINFASLFSGTAVAVPRSVSAGLKLAF